jgi:hypothetical protein
MCNRAILLDHGRIVLDGPTEDVLDTYSRMNKDGPPNVAAAGAAADDAAQAPPIAAGAV